MVKKAEEIAIKVKGVSKTFKLPHEKNSSIKSAIVNVGKRKKGYEIQQALKNISFEVKKGEFFGIVGRNGSGKSTLLKLISEIYTPDSGKITVNGKLTPFIELGVGFNPELSGRDNVFLNGALLGFSRAQMDAMYDEIVEFAELERFMDQKLKNYSSGMQVRLAFSIAIQADTDILVLDEVLAVGDEAFQRKCFQYFAKLKKNKKTVILVTHDMDAVQRFCNSAIMIEDGVLSVCGKPSDVARGYRKLFSADTTVSNSTILREENKYFDVEAENNIDLELKTIGFDIGLIPKADIKDAVITFEIIRDNGEPVYRWVTDEKLTKKIDFVRNKKIKLALTIDNIFPDGVFNAQIGVKKRDRSMNYILLTDATRFEIIGKSRFPGDIQWKPIEKFTLG